MRVEPRLIVGPHAERVPIQPGQLTDRRIAFAARRHAQRDLARRRAGLAQRPPKIRAALQQLDGAFHRRKPLVRVRHLGVGVRLPITDREADIGILAVECADVVRRGFDLRVVKHNSR